VRGLELAVGVALVGLGVRSLWYWARRPFEGTDVTDHVLYALYVTARVGLWFAFAGLFLLSASIPYEGRAFLDEFERYRWFLIVPIGLAALQLGAGWFLGRRGDREADEPEVGGPGARGSSGNEASRRP